MFERPRTSLPVLALLLLLPQSIYVIGDYLAIGIRFPFFRYQLTMEGTGAGLGNSTLVAGKVSIITVPREFGYLTSGIIKWQTTTGQFNPTAIATLTWLAGLVVLILAAVLVISWQLLGNNEHAGFPGPLIIITGVLFLIWAMVQYRALLLRPHRLLHPRWGSPPLVLRLSVHAGGEK